MESSEKLRFRAFADLSRAAVGGASTLVHDPFFGKTAIVDKIGLQALGCVTAFDSMASHVSRLAELTRLPPVRCAEMLRSLLDRGLLHTEADLLAALRGSTLRPTEPVRIERLGIPTRGRTASLLRAIESHEHNAREHGRSLQIAVCSDDAVGPAAECAQAVAALALELGATITWVGPAERARYTATLARHGGFDPELIGFALGRDADGLPSNGAARNTLLLEAIGTALVMVDDDTLCELKTPLPRLAGLALDSRGDPAELWFAGAGLCDWGATSEHLRDVDGDHLGLHETLLGLDLGTCLAREPTLELDALSARTASRWSHATNVSTTQLGSYGDSGTGSLGHYLLIQGRSRARLHASEPSYRQAWASRRVARAVLRPTLSDTALCMSMDLGLDLRRILPPFCPRLRNSDGLHGATVAATAREHATGLLPYLLCHEPPTPRTSSFETFLHELGGIDANDIICRLIPWIAPRPGPTDPVLGLRQVGQSLELLADLPVQDFEAQVRERVLANRAVDLALLSDSLRRHDFEPTYWALEVRRAHAELAERILDPAYSRARDLEQGFGSELGRARFRKHVRQFGRLLRSWPDIWQAAVELQATGVRPSEPGGVRCSGV